MARGGGFVGDGGLDAGVVDGEFFEVGEDGDGELGGPGVASELVGGGGVAFDVDGGFFGFEEELTGAADAEAVVGGFGSAAGAGDFDGVFVDDVFVGVGVAGGVGHVPAECGEEGVEEFAAELGFVVIGGGVGVGVAGEAIDEIGDGGGNGHGLLREGSECRQGCRDDTGRRGGIRGWCGTREKRGDAMCDGTGRDDASVGGRTIARGGLELVVGVSFFWWRRGRGRIVWLRRRGRRSR